MKKKTVLDKSWRGSVVRHEYVGGNSQVPTDSTPFKGAMLEDAISDGISTALGMAAGNPGHAFTLSNIRCVCGHCGGAGSVRKTIKGVSERINCKACDHMGVFHTLKTIEIKIPEYVELKFKKGVNVG